MSHLLSYAINHMVAPRKSFAELVALANALELDAVEIRNDLPGTAILDGTEAAKVRDQAEAGGVRILSINALQRFNEWNVERELEARALARYAQDCGAAMLVLCPVNDVSYRLAERERLSGLRDALRALAPILGDAGIIGPGRAARLSGELAAAAERGGRGDRGLRASAIASGSSTTPSITSLRASRTCCRTGSGWSICRESTTRDLPLDVLRDRASRPDRCRTTGSATSPRSWHCSPAAMAAPSPSSRSPRACMPATTSRARSSAACTGSIAELAKAQV